MRIQVGFSYRTGTLLSSLCQVPPEAYSWTTKYLWFCNPTIGPKDLVTEHTAVARFTNLHQVGLPIHVLEAIQRYFIYQLTPRETILMPRNPSASQLDLSSNKVVTLPFLKPLLVYESKPWQI